MLDKPRDRKHDYKSKSNAPQGTNQATLKRYPELEQSECMFCGKFLAVCSRAATYSGELVCRKCGGINVFSNSHKPVALKNPEVPR